MARLRDRLSAWPQAKRFIVHGDWHPPIDEVINATDGFAAVVYVMPVTDTCKEVVDGVIQRTVPRDDLAVAQGPWVFSHDALAAGLARISGREADIDTLLTFCEVAQLRVRTIPRP
ncbi:MAG TPA: 2-C-methyl-D-erythritol 4-phosphate cytidylyltransferase [Candidatus Dormibacteraeota bacterium]|nr:2-C-methyl-D-erythritol 4-phosphate cytidylyltransferase [Candidatus Dormibacteraeota bacterium]